MNKITIKILATQTRKEIGRTTKYSLTEYVNSLGYKVTYSKHISTAYLDKNDNTVYIPITNEEFTLKMLAHELGHLKLSHHCIFVNDTVRHESEADYFAYCLLKINYKYKTALVILSVFCCSLMAFALLVTQTII